MKKYVVLICMIILVILSCIITTIYFSNKTKTIKAAVVENIVEEDTIDIETLSTNEGEEKNSDDDIFIPSPTPQPTSLNKTITKSVPKVNNMMYYIKVNNEMNTVTIYTKDTNGEYTIPVRAMICSTGYASPQNSKYQLKSRWEWRALFGGVYGQYSTHINGNILFHSVPYLKQYDHSSLEYWEYDKLGTTCSAGCVRLTVEDAKWIYYNCPAGTWVEFYNSSNPGPLGKPISKKISDNMECKNWDPTDLYVGNPWNNKIEESTSIPTPTIEPSPIIENTVSSALPTETPILEITEENNDNTQIDDIISENQELESNLEENNE